MESKGYILVNRISRQEYMGYRMKYVFMKQAKFLGLYLIIFIGITKNVIWDTSLDFFHDSIAISVEMMTLIFVIGFFVMRIYIKTKKYYKIHIQPNKEERFILLAEGFKREGEEMLIPWLGLSKAKRSGNLIAFSYGLTYIMIWNEASMTDEIKQYLKTKIRGFV